MNDLEKLKEILSGDKRLCERLELPVHIRYAQVRGEEQVVWSKPVLLDNIGGEGLGFTDTVCFEKGERLNIELTFLDKSSPVYFGAEIVWVKEGLAQQGQGCEYSYGLRIYECDAEDKKRLEHFMADKIMDAYLDEQGGFKDQEGLSDVE